MMLNEVKFLHKRTRW